MKSMLKLSIISFLVISMLSCKSVDLRTDVVIHTPNSNEQKGKQLLEKAVIAMGYDKLLQAQVYEATAQFNWKGIWLTMPMNALPGNNNKEIKFRFVTNSFDGQVEYLEGRKKGTIQGLQSWKGYKTEANSDYLKQHEHDRYIWGLATYHYLLEAPYRVLHECDIIRYAGEKSFQGKNFDMVYATWGTETPNKKYDRWLLYINKETGFIDMLEVTINDFFLPMPKAMQHATVHLERKKTSIGTYLPSNVIIQLKSPKKKDSKVYSFKLGDYKFDSFEKEMLYPIKNLPFFGNSKPEETK